MPSNDKIIGRVAVKVSPDLSRFKDEAQRTLTRIEDQLNLKVNVVPNISTTAVRELQGKLDELGNRLRTDVSIVPTLNAAHAARLRAQLDELTRPRDTTVNVNVNRSAVAGLASAERAAGGLSTRVTSLIGLLVAAPPKLLAFGSAAIVSANNLLTLAGSLASIAPLALAAPGALAGFGVVLTALVIAMKDATKRVPALVTAWAKVKQTITDNFWTKATKPIRNLVDTLLPGIGKGFAQVSYSLGGFAGKLSNALGAKLKSTLPQMFADTARSINRLGDAAPALANILAILGKLGASVLPRLAGGFVSVSDRLNAFLTKAQGNGSLTRWVDTAITNLKALGSALASAGSILAGFYRAASAAGGSTLQSLATNLRGIATVVNSPGFQTGLIGVFQGARTVVQALSASLVQVGNALAQALASDAVQGAIRALVSALGVGLQAVTTAAVGLIPVLTPVVALLGNTFATVIRDLAPIVAQLASTLGAVLTPIIGALTAVLATLIPPAVQIVRVLGDLVARVLPPLAVVFAKVLTIIANGAAQLATSLVPVLDTIGTVLAKLVTDLAPVLPPLVQAVVSFGVAVGGLIAAVAPVLPPLGQLLGIFGRLAGGVVIAVYSALTLVVRAVTPLVSILAQLVNGVLKVVVLAFQGWGSLLSGPVYSAIKATISVVKLLLGPLLAAVAALNKLLAPVRAATGALNVLKSTVQSVKGGFTTFGDALRGVNGIGLNGGFFDKAIAKLNAVTAAAAAATEAVLQAASAAAGGGGIQGFSHIKRLSTALGGSYTGAYTPDSGSGSKAANAKAAKAAFDASTLGQFLALAKNITTNPLTESLNAILTSASAAGKKLSASFVAGLRRENSTLAGLVNQRTALAAKLATAQQALAAALSAKASEASSVASTVMGTFDINNIGAFGTPTSIIAQLNDAVAKAKQFGTVLKALAKSGLPQGLLRLLAEAGPAALPQALAFQRSNPQELAEIKQSYAQLGAASKDIGSFIAGNLYDAGINTAKGLIAGIQSQQGAVNAAITKLANTMIAQLRKSLGIHSPSREFAKLGVFTGLGLLNGLESTYDSVHSSLAAFGAELSKGNFADLSIGAQVDAARGDGSTASGSVTHKTLNYYAAPGNSLSSEEDLFAAGARTRFGW